uniref:(northern house mosquito) hypothetical protein n=1 Tax=Culex pipiens TaxID=7175 RepID=A0A8D8BRU7_CULPI
MPLGGARRDRVRPESGLGDAAYQIRRRLRLAKREGQIADGTGAGAQQSKTDSGHATSGSCSVRCATDGLPAGATGERRALADVLQDAGDLQNGQVPDGVAGTRGDTLKKDCYEG